MDEYADLTRLGLVCPVSADSEAQSILGQSVGSYFLVIVAAYFSGLDVFYNLTGLTVVVDRVEEYLRRLL